MNRPELYFRTTKSLLDAYRKETLFHNTYGCCADGQIIAAAMGYEVVSKFLFTKDKIFSQWLRENGDEVEFINEWKWGTLLVSQNIIYQAYVFLKLGSAEYRLQRKHLASTGYSLKELNKIMQAFDSCYDGQDETKNILAGLKMVLQVLKAMHSVDHFDAQTIYREKFVLENQILNELPERYNWLVNLENKILPNDSELKNASTKHWLSNEVCNY